MVLRGAPLRRVDEHARRDRRHVVQWLAEGGEREQCLQSPKEEASDLEFYAQANYRSSVRAK